MATYFCNNPACLKPLHRAPSQVRGAVYCDRDCFEAVRTRACPFTAAELERMHWQECLGMAPIGELVVPPVTPKVVERWFEEAGIATRNLAEHNRNLAAAGHSAANAEIAREELARLREEEGLITSRAEAMHTAEAVARQRAAMAARRKTELRACQRPGCSNIVSRKPGQFEEHWYCSKECAGKNQNNNRYSVKQVFFCETCKRPFVDFPSKRNQPHIFCSRRCSGLFGKTKFARPCSQCGKMVEKPPSHMDGAEVFCDINCRREWLQGRAIEKKEKPKSPLPDGYISIQEAMQVAGRRSRQNFIVGMRKIGAYLALSQHKGAVHLATLQQHMERMEQERIERRTLKAEPVAPPDGFVSIKDAAVILGISTQAVHARSRRRPDALRKTGRRIFVNVESLKSPARGVSQKAPDAEESAAMRKSYEAGTSIKDLCQQFKRNPLTVRRGIIEAGGTIRPRGWPTHRAKNKLTQAAKAIKALNGLSSEDLQAVIRAAQELLKGGLK